MAELLIIRPESDDVERALSGWADRIKLEVSRNPELFADVAVRDLSGSFVTRGRVEGEAASADVVVYFGHGDRSSLGTAEVYIDGNNVKTLAKTAVIAVACLSADELGPLAINDGGATTYWGWKDELVLVLPQNPFRTVIEPAITAFLLGDSIGQAYKRLEDSFERLERQYHPNRRKASADLATLIWASAKINRLSMVLLGDDEHVLP